MDILIESQEHFLNRNAQAIKMIKKLGYSGVNGENGDKFIKTINKNGVLEASVYENNVNGHLFIIRPKIPDTFTVKIPASISTTQIGDWFPYTLEYKGCTFVLDDGGDLCVEAESIDLLVELYDLLYIIP